MANLFSAVNSGVVQKFYGRVTSTKQASGKFSEYTDISVAVDKRGKADGEQYAPSVFVSALTLDTSIQKGDKVIIEGVLRDREYEGKTYYQLSPFVVLPVTVVERAGGENVSPAKNTSSKPTTTVEEDDDDDF